MRIAFFGTPEFAEPTLEALSSSHDVVCVLTRPDAVRLRGKELVASPVKKRALELGLTVVEAAKITPEINEMLRDLNLDFIVVVAFGCIIPQETLDIPRYECLNVHGSLLPRWRGAAPIQRAILSQDERIGISIMRVVKALDAGPYCRQASVEGHDRSFFELASILAQLGAQETLIAIDEITQATVSWTDQDETELSYAEKIDKHEMLLSPSLTAQENYLKVLASSDAAPAKAQVAERPLRIYSARKCADELVSAEVSIIDGRLVLGCLTGSLELEVVKPDGKREMSAQAFVVGLKGQALNWSSLS